jgi:hypothetical protein
MLSFPGAATAMGFSVETVATVSFGQETCPPRRKDVRPAESMATSEEHPVCRSAQTTLPHIRQWCLLKVHVPKSCWQNGHLGTVLSSSHVTTDCSRSFLWFFCPDNEGDNNPAFADTFSGALSSSRTNLANRFSSLETSRLCRSTRFLLMSANVAV